MKNKIREHREAAGLTQGQLAKKLKMKQANLSHIERGASKDQGLNWCRKIARVFSVTLDELFPKK